MPYRLSRSLILWLGLPGFLFIFWSWHDSLTHEWGISRSHSQSHGLTRITSNDFIGHSRAALLIQWHLISPADLGKFATGSPTLVREPILPPAPEEGWKAVFPPRINGTRPRDFPTVRVVLRKIAIPHWQILILYSLAWAGCMTWRWRRARKLMEPVATEA